MSETTGVEYPDPHSVLWGVLLAGLVSFAAASVILAGVPPATGFENYIVAAYPRLFWACFLLALSAAILVFVGSAVLSSTAWKPAFGLLAAVYGVFFYLPVHRGYELYDRAGSDTLAHLGFVKQTVETGAIPGLFYPLEHAFLSGLVFHGVPLDVARHTLSFGVTLIFILSVGLLLRELSGNADAFPVGLAVATPLVFMSFQVRIHPAMLSFMFIPIFVFLIERARAVDATQFRVLYASLAFAIVFFHPMTTVFLLVLLFSTAVFWKLVPYAGESPRWPLQTRLAPLVGVVWFHWYAGFGRTRRSIQEVFLSITGQTKSNVVGDQIASATRVEFTLVELAVRFIRKYGADFLYFAVAGLFGLLVIKRFYLGRARPDTSYATMQFFLGMGIATLFLFVYLIAFDAVRVARYAIVMAVVLVGLALHYAVQQGGKRPAAIAVGITCVVLLAGGLGTVGGTTYWPNEHMTHAEYEGSEFVLEYHDPALDVRSHGLHEKMQIYVTGSRFREGRGADLRSDREFRVPPGLGYPEHDTAAETFGSSYLVTQAYDVRFTESRYFTEEQRAFLSVYDRRHLRRLARDPTASKVYANGEFTLWRIDGDE